MTHPQFLSTSFKLLLCAVFAAGSASARASATPTLPSFQAGILAVSSGLCVTVPGAAATPGLLLPQSPCASFAQQYFSFLPQSDGTYVFHSPVALSLCLDLNDSGLLVQNYCVPTASQRWLATENADGTYAVTNQQSQACLTSAAPVNGVAGGFSTAPCAGSNPQRFTLLLPQFYTPPSTPPTRTPPVVPLTPTVGQWQAGYFHGLPYRILFPDGYDPTHYVYPLVLFLHGDGDAGTDNTSQLRDVLNVLAGDYDLRSKVPMIMLAPQCPTTDIWGNPFSSTATPTETLTVGLTESLVSALPIDSTRVSVTGLSMGGIGAWDMINRYPTLFGVAAPIAGAGNPMDAPNLVNVPILAVHGGADLNIPPTFDEVMYADIHALGGKMQYIEIKGAAHDVWDVTYSQTAFWQWLVSQQHD
ncbi:MAG TPA: ricin-type beta-trefoil lectin domain protein [Acidobacteriaceae bacterium]